MAENFAPITLENLINELDEDVVLNFTEEQLRLYYLFNSYDSPLVKFFKTKIKANTEGSYEQSGAYHGQAHVVGGVDRIPYTNELAEKGQLSEHPGLFKPDWLKMLLKHEGLLTDDEDNVTPIDEILGFVNTEEDHALLVYDKIMVGAIHNTFSDPEVWDMSLTKSFIGEDTERGIYSFGNIKSEGKLISTLEAIFKEGLYSAGLINARKGVLVEDSDIEINRGKLIIDGVEVQASGSEGITSSLLTIVDDVGVLKAPVIQTVHEDFSNIIFRPLGYYEYAEGQPNTAVNNALVISQTTSANAKVHINIPTNDEPGLAFPNNANLWVNGNAVFGYPLNTNSQIYTYGNSLVSLSYTDFSIIHGLDPQFSNSQPKLNIISGGGLNLQTSDLIDMTAKVTVGSLTRRVGIKNYGNLHIDSQMTYDSTQSTHPSNFAFAFVNETGSSIENVLGSPMAIRNDGHVGIGMLPDFSITDATGHQRSSVKNLNVSGGADFINMQTVGFNNIVTASIFENPGNKIEYFQGTTIPVESAQKYYANSGMLTIRGANLIDVGANEYDVRITGKKLPYMDGLSVNTTGKYFGTRMDGGVHFYNNDNALIVNIGYESTNVNVDPDAIKDANIIEFRNRGSFYTPKGNFITSEGDVKILNGDLHLKHYPTPTDNDWYGIDVNADAKIRSFHIPEATLPTISSNFPLDLYYGQKETGDFVANNISLYGNLFFRQKADIDLLGGSLLNVHDIKGSTDTVSPGLTNDDGDVFGGKISGFKSIEGSSEIGSVDGEYAQISGFYSIRGQTESENITYNQENKKYNKITGFQYLIGSGSGYIRNFKDIYGEYDIGEENTKNAVYSSGSGDIKYFRNIQGINVDPLADSGVKEFLTGTTTNINDTTASPNEDGSQPQFSLVENNIPDADYWNPTTTYNGGDLIDYQNITGLDNIRYRGSITNYKEIELDSFIATYSEGYILPSIINIGNWKDYSYDDSFRLAKKTGFVFKGGEVLDEFDRLRTTTLSAAFVYEPPKVSTNASYPKPFINHNPNVTPVEDKDYFSLHYSNSSGDKSGGWVDLKVGGIWLNGYKVYATADELNALVSDGVLFTNGLNWMKSDLHMQERDIDAGDPGIVVDPTEALKWTGTKHNIYGVDTLYTDYVYNFNNEYTSDTSKDFKFGTDFNQQFHTFAIHSSNTSWIIPGINSISADLVLAYRDTIGNEKEGIRIKSTGEILAPGLIFKLSADPNSPQMFADGSGNLVFGVPNPNSPPEFLPALVVMTDGKATVGGVEFALPDPYVEGEVPFWKMYLDKSISSDPFAVMESTSEHARIISSNNLELNSSKVTINSSIPILSFSYLLNDYASIQYDNTNKVLEFGLYENSNFNNSIHISEDFRVGIGEKYNGSEFFRNGVPETKFEYSSVSDTIYFTNEEFVKLELISTISQTEYQYKVTFTQPSTFPRTFFKDTDIGDFVSVGGITSVVKSKTDINDDSYYFVGDSDLFITFSYNWQLSYSYISALEVRGRIKADNLELDGSFSGDINSECIFLGKKGGNRGYIRVNQNDMQLHTGTTTGRNLKFFNLNKDVLFYTGTNGTDLSFAIKNDLSAEFYGKVTFYDDDKNPLITIDSSSKKTTISKILNVTEHNGVDLGLQLNGVLITSLSSDLNLLEDMSNYLGIAKKNQTLVLGSNKDIDEITIGKTYLDEWFINSTKVLPTGSELNVLENVNTDLTFEQLEYLVKASPGVSEKETVITLDDKYATNFMRVGNLEISLDPNNIYGSQTITTRTDKYYDATIGDSSLNSVRGVKISSNNGGYVSLGVGENSLGDDEAMTLSDLIVDSVVAIRQHTTTVPTLTKKGHGYLYVNVSTQDLNYVYYNGVESKTTNLTADRGDWLLFSGTNNIYYNEGNVAVYPKNSLLPNNFQEAPNAKAKMHLFGTRSSQVAFGSALDMVDEGAWTRSQNMFLLRHIKDPDSVNSGTPNIKIQKIVYDSFPNTLKNNSLDIGFKHRGHHGTSDLEDNPTQQINWGSNIGDFKVNNQDDPYYAHIGTSNEKLYIDTYTDKDIVMQYQRGFVGVGTRLPQHKLHVEDNETYPIKSDQISLYGTDVDKHPNSNAIALFKNIEGAEYNSVELASRNSSVVRIEHNFQHNDFVFDVESNKSTNHPIANIRKNQTLIDNSLWRIWNIKNTEHLATGATSDLEKTYSSDFYDVEYPFNSILSVLYNQSSVNAETHNIFSYYRPISDTQGIISNPPVFNVSNDEYDLFKVDDRGYVGINAGSFKVDEFWPSAADEPTGWIAERHPMHSQITQPLTIDNKDIDGRGIKVVGKRPTVYLGSDIKPYQVIQAHPDTAPYTPHTQHNFRNNVSTLLMMAADEIIYPDSPSTSSVKSNEGGQLEMNYVREWRRWTDQLKSSNPPGTVVLNSAWDEFDSNYLEFRIKDFSDVTDKHKRRLVITEDGVGIGASFNRGMNLGKDWEPSAMLDVQGDMNLTSFMVDTDSTNVFEQYLKNDMSKRPTEYGGNAYDIMMDIKSRGYVHQGDITLKKEYPEITDPGWSTNPNAVKIHDNWTASIESDNFSDIKYYDSGVTTEAEWYKDVGGEAEKQQEPIIDPVQDQIDREYYWIEVDNLGNSSYPLPSSIANTTIQNIEDTISGSNPNGFALTTISLYYDPNNPNIVSESIVTSWNISEGMTYDPITDTWSGTPEYPIYTGVKKWTASIDTDSNYFDDSRYFIPSLYYGWYTLSTTISGGFKTNYRYSYEDAVRVSATKNSYISSGNIGIGFIMPDIQWQIITDPEDDYIRHRLDTTAKTNSGTYTDPTTNQTADYTGISYDNKDYGTFSASYQEENTTRLQIFHTDQKPYPKLDIHETRNLGQYGWGATGGQGVHLKPNYDSIAKFSDPNSYFELFPLYKQTINNSSLVSDNTWAKIDIKTTAGGNIGSPNGFNMETDGHFVLNTTGTNKDFEFLDYNKTTFKRTTGGESYSLTLTDNLIWDGKYSSLDLNETPDNGGFEFIRKAVGANTLTSLTLNDDFNWNGKNSDLVMDIDLLYTGQNSSFQSSTHLKWTDASNIFSVNETSKDSMFLNHTLPSLGMSMTDEKIGAWRADFQTDQQGTSVTASPSYFSGGYWKGMAVDVMDNVSKHGNNSLTRFINKINRTGDDGGYVTIATDIPTKLSSEDIVSDYIINDFYFQVSLVTLVQYNGNDNRTPLGSSTTNKVYFEVDESTITNASTDNGQSVSSQGKWEDQMGSLLLHDPTVAEDLTTNHHVVPYTARPIVQKGDTVTLTETTGAFASHDYVIESLNKIEYTNGGKVVYEATLTEDLDLGDYDESGGSYTWPGIDSSGGSGQEFIFTNTWRLTWEKNEYAKLTVDGKLDYFGSGAAINEWITLDPTKGDTIILKDSNYGNSSHIFLQRNFISQGNLNEDVVITSLDPSNQEIIDVRNTSNPTDAIRSDLIFRTFNWDLTTGNSANCTPVERIKIEDSHKTSGGTIDYSRIYLYEDVDVGVDGQPNKDLMVYGDISNIGKITTNELLINDNLNNLRLSYDPDDTTPTLDVSGIFKVSGDIDANGSLDVYGNTVLNGNLTVDVNDLVSFGNSVLELNRIQKDETLTSPDNTDINLSGLTFNRGDQPKSSILYSEGNSANHLDDLFLLLKDYENFSTIFDSINLIDNNSNINSVHQWDINDIPNIMDASTSPPNPIEFTAGGYWQNDADNSLLSANASNNPPDVGWTFIGNNPNQYEGWSYSLAVGEDYFTKQRRYSASHFSDLRLENIYLKGFWLSNEANDGFEKLLTSATELNQLNGITVGSTEINTLLGIDTSTTVQTQINDLAFDKVTKDWYIDLNDGTKTLATGVKGFNLIEDSPFYFRTRQHVSDKTKDEFLAITKGTGSATYTTSDDDKGGALQYYFTDDVFSIKGYPYIHNANPNTQNNISGADITAYQFNGDGTYVVDTDASYHPVPGPGGTNPVPTHVANEWYIDPNSSIQYDVTVNQPAENYFVENDDVVGHLYNENYDARTNIYETPNISLQDNWGNVAIGTNNTEYGLHVNKNIQKHWTTDSGSVGDGLPLYRLIAGDYVLATDHGGGYAPYDKDKYYNPVVAFFGKTPYQYDLEPFQQTGSYWSNPITGEAQPLEPDPNPDSNGHTWIYVESSGTIPLSDGSIKVRMSPRPDFEYTGYEVLGERDTNIVDLEVNSWVSTGTTMGSNGAFNIRNYYSKTDGLGGDINLITSDIPTLSNTKMIVNTGIGMQIGAMRKHGHVGIGTTARNDAILTIANRVVTGTSLDYKTNASILFQNDLANDVQQVIWLTDEGKLEIANQLDATTGEPLDAAFSVASDKVEVGFDFVATMQLVEHDLDAARQTQINSGFYQQFGAGIETIRIVSIHEDTTLNRYVLRADRDLKEYDVSEGSSISFTRKVGDNHVGIDNELLIGAVHNFVDSKYYDDIEGKLVTTSNNAITLTLPAPKVFSENYKFSLTKNYSIAGWADGSGGGTSDAYFNGSYSFLEGTDINTNPHRPRIFELDDSSYNKFGRNIVNDVEVQIQITAKHDDLWDGNSNETWATSADFYNRGGGSRVGHGLSSNMGTYRWRRTWLQEYDHVDVKDDTANDSAGLPFTKWQEDIPYDIYYNWEESADTYMKHYRRLSQKAYISTNEGANSLTHYGNNYGSGIPIWYDTSYNNNGGDVASDLDLWIAINPFDVIYDGSAGTIMSFVLQAGGITSRSALVNVGTEATPFAGMYVDGTNSIHIGEAHLQESTNGGLRIATSDLEMKSISAAEYWTDPTDSNNLVYLDPNDVNWVYTAGESYTTATDMGMVYVNEDDKRLWFMDENGFHFDVLAGSGGGGNLGNVTSDVIPGELNDVNIGKEGTVEGLDGVVGGDDEYSDRLTFKDIFIEGSYKKWNNTTKSYDIMGEQTISAPTHHAIQVNANSNTYVINDSNGYFTTINNKFDNTILQSYLDVDFDWDVSANTIDNDNGTTTTISDPATYFSSNPEIVVLSTSLIVPLDFNSWRADAYNKIKVKVSNVSDVEISVKIYDTSTSLVDVEETLDLTGATSWTDIELTKFDTAGKQWTKGDPFSLVLTAKLKKIDASVQLSTMSFQYNTESYTTSSVPLPHITSTATTTSVDQELVTLDVKPDLDNSRALGASDKRYTTLYSQALNTGDINLNNENSEGNEVDGTTGNWTVQEGEEDLFIINRKTGKKFKFKLEEIE